jgi:5-oxoprolinase (ATP-hydrolysing) subunit A
LTNSSTTAIDLNADLGESFGRWTLGDDAALLPFLSSANVACGFHAGDALTLQRTVAEATARGVVVGAQVSYRDLAGFGRREMSIASDELTADVLYQIGALEGLCRVAGTAVRYVKPHGALYHRTLRDPEQAEALVQAVRTYDPTLPILTMAGGQLDRIARDLGLRVAHEGFADRSYGPDGLLVPRTQPDALITDPATAARQAVALARGGDVTSLCIHGDTPTAVEIGRAVREGLYAEGIAIRSFARG